MTEPPSATDLVGQKLLSAEEVYLYKIPPLKTAGGHRAEDWNLATPLKTCSLLVEQHGDKLLLLFRHLQDPDDPNSIQIFAQSTIDLSSSSTNQPQKLSLEYFVENVVDSSRYFVVRILDERSGREARIGFGFRDRDEATDFRESLQFFVKSIKRREEAEQAKQHFAKEYDNNQNLSLQEGQKIHINLGSGKKSTISKKDSSSQESPKKAGGPFLLKKPPPAPKLNPDVSISFGDIDLNADSKTGEESTTAALGEASSADDDDIWQDFEEAQEE
ncbi:ear-binding coat-associated protein 2 [Seminavis robusta]|uniref:Ear-binding coat-associated protein 2 n=1 Tax=Seminavis robusta TaxID=568900 RepID=A0A9N8DUY0_9STRA|nr:ear-binding coat-associated protein 2 [Seminavis robusta]|eukprot:Sro266_g103130.1 ear-binding coat-associated protein 2 (274) ;mRNA; r:34662-35588